MTLAKTCFCIQLLEKYKVVMSTLDCEQFLIFLLVSGASERERKRAAKPRVTKASCQGKVEIFIIFNFHDRTPSFLVPRSLQLRSSTY